MTMALCIGDREALDPHCMRPGEAARLLAGARWHRFVVLGDSIAEGVGEEVEGYAPAPWADRVAQALRAVKPRLRYANLGRRDKLAEEVRAEQLPAAIEERPDLAAVLAGGNDLLRRRFDPDAVESELAHMIGALRARGCDVITMGLFDITRSQLIPPEQRAPFHARLEALAARTRAVSERFGTLHVDFTGHPAASEDIYSSDGLHLNHRGHAIVLAETVRRLGMHVRAAGQPATYGRAHP
jgi:lysophospholipase L1-like esterase